MKSIQVFGSGCKKCQATADLIQKVARDLEVEIDLKKVEDLQEIIAAGVMFTPAVSIDGELVHRGGGVPDADKVKSWLTGVA